MGNRRKTTIHAIVAAIALLLGIAAIEGVATLLHYQKHGAWRTSCLANDPDLGWDILPGCSLALRTLEDEAGKAYGRTYEADRIGSRLWGDAAADRLQVLIVGDSFTEAREVSNDKTYYAVLADQTDFEIFAYGVRGYGTLQELIKTRQLLDLVHPDIFILQFCSNDFVNNSMGSEAFSIFENQKIRPYWVDGAIRHAYGESDLYPMLLHYSVAFRLLDIVVQTVRARWHGGDMPTSARPAVEALHDEALDTTETLMAKLAEALPESTDRFAFNCKGGEGNRARIEADRDFKSVAAAAGFEVIDGLAADAEDYGREQGVNVNAGGGHMNELGQQLWGRFLADYLKRRYPPSSKAPGAMTTTMDAPLSKD